MPTKTATTKTAATQEWKGNYSIVMVPFADDIAEGFDVTLTHTTHSAMLRTTRIEGPRYHTVAELLDLLQGQVVEALRAWQKANIESRRGLTDMEKYLQHRRFIAGFGQAVGAQLAGRTIRNSKSDEAALRDGRAAGKAAEVAR